MKYYRAKEEGYDYFNRHGVVKGELLTPHERETKVRYISDENFEKVEISQRDTFKNFGVRLASSDVKTATWTLTRAEAEERILTIAQRIRRVYLDYCEDDNFLTLSWLLSDYDNEWTCMFFNTNASKKLDFHSRIKRAHLATPERLATEDEIYSCMLEVKYVLEEYSPECRFLDLTIRSDGSIHMFNDYWRKRTKHIIDFSEN